MTKETYIKIRDELKSIIKDIAKCRGHNKRANSDRQRYVSKNTKTIGYQGALWEKALKDYPSVDGEFSKRYSEEFATALHILYNQFRNRPAHLGSPERDELFLNNQGNYSVIDLFEKIKENHQDV